MEISLGSYRLEVATEFGPRITSLRREDGPEILATLGPEARIEHEGEVYLFHGGHRLWASPEVADITYASDDHECEVTVGQGTVTVSAPADRAGVGKELTISSDATTLIVDHRITANGDSPALAPWAITQLPTGGTAIMPIVGEETAPLPNRQIVLWPYTSLQDPRLRFRHDALTIEAIGESPMKVGSGPTPGRLGYYRSGSLFVKEIEAAGDLDVPDFGAVGQVYVGQGFCELESVGGIVDLSAGRVATLRERWRVIDCTDVEAACRMTLEGIEP
jgi:hypothetical protein